MIRRIADGQQLYPDLATVERYLVAGGVVEAGAPGGAWFLGGALDGDALLEEGRSSRRALRIR